MLHKDTIQVEVKGAVATLTLNRPSVHNAMNLEMIRQMTGTIESLVKQTSVRILILRSEGTHFSAGADLNWMRDGIVQSRDQLVAESRELARIFRMIFESDLLVMVAIQGKVLGGAIGLVAAADLVIAETTASFAFSEVKLGLVPATIAPYVLRKAGHGKTSDWMFTGRIFDAKEASTAGLVQYICHEGTLPETTKKIVGGILSGGPEAQKGIKQLLRDLIQGQVSDEIQEKTAKLIGQYRISEEGQEGINAFFEKRNPGWDETV